MTRQPRRALVVGGSGAIGGAICVALARDGFDVALTYRHNESGGAKSAAAVGQYTVASVHQLDVADLQAVERLMSQYASLDAVIYAAGPSVPMRFVEAIESVQFTHQLNTDAIGCFNLVRTALPRLRAAKGALVAVVTVAIARTVPRDLLSAAPKAVVEQIIRAVAIEYGKYGVRANCVAPGLVDGGMIHDLLESGDYNQSTIDAARQNTPMRCLGAPEDVAEAVGFFASAKARWITGQTLFVDGGYAL
jgi:3-oxoacyl-[acyl-carrier protein] reductase